MKTTFKTEDERKDKLFYFWSEHLLKVDAELSGKFNGLQVEFDKVTEDLGEVIRCSESEMELRLDNRMIKIPISPQISQFTQKADLIYLAMGKYRKTWWPLDIISIGSFVDKRDGSFHMTINPRLVARTEGENCEVH